MAAALCLSGLFVAQASYSAFSATVSTTNNTASSATLSLTTSVATKAITLTNMLPGATTTAVVAITDPKNTAASAVKMYSANFTESPSTGNYIPDNLNITITEGTQASDGTFVPDKTGPKSNGVIFNDSLTNFAKITSWANSSGTTVAVGNWAPAKESSSDQTKYYQIVVSFSSNAGNNAQGQSAGFDLVWEAR